MRKLWVVLAFLTITGCAHRHYIGVRESEPEDQLTSLKFSSAFKIYEIDGKHFDADGALGGEHIVMLRPGPHQFNFRYDNGVGRTGYDTVLKQFLEAGKKYEIATSFKKENRGAFGPGTVVYFEIREIVVR